MKVEEQIKAYISGQPEAKSIDMNALYKRIQQVMPHC